MLRYKPSPTGEAFLASRAFLKFIMGPVGGGKSTVALMDLVQRAVHQEPFNNVRRTKFVILRNTIAQLKSTVKPMMDTWFVTMTLGTMGQWRISDNVFEARFRLPDNTIVHSEFVLMAADTPEDVRRLLSLECSAAWVEEAREVDSEVFAGLQGRTNRFPSRIAGGVTHPGVICSTNPPPLGGFWHGFATEPEKNKEIFIQPPALLDDGALNPDAENLENLAPDYYENLLSGKTEDWINVYLKNQYGAGDMGRPIYRDSFKKSFHVAKNPLLAIPQSLAPLLIGMDNGLQAAAVIGQRDARGRVNILGECFVPEDKTMGVESFMDQLLLPYLALKFPQFKRENIHMRMDPACWQRSQVDEKTIAMAVAARGFKPLKASTNVPERRVQAVEGLLARQIDGGPAFLVDRDCTHVTNTLEWGHRYKKSTNGVQTVVAEKNHYSHCFVAGTLVLTDSGPVPIEKITCDSRVVTPWGERPVTATMNHVAEELLELEVSTGEKIICTPDHPFFTDKGVLLADDLQYNEVLYSPGEKPCDANTLSVYLKVSATTGSQRGTSKRITKNTAGERCTGLSGNTPTDPFQTNTTSTTSMVTRLTTALKTWSASLPLSTCATTQRREIPPPMGYNEVSTPSKKAALEPLNGTAASRAEPGIQPTERNHGQAASAWNLFVTTAVARTKATKAWSKRVFARLHVRGAQEKLLGLTMKFGNAPSAPASSLPTSTSKQKHAVRLVGKKRLAAQNARVYDLTVDTDHCFYANGILVHNCGDALQYLALHFNDTSGGGDMRTKAKPVTKHSYAYT